MAELSLSKLESIINTKANATLVTTSTHGLMSKEDKTKLNSLTKYNFSTTAPPGRSFGQSSTVGTSSTMARSDHAHAMPTTTEVFNAVKGHHGSGSGLDADLLDGKHASAFALEGHTHNYAAATHLHSNITITAGNGLSGGGTLAANRTITLGTPGTLTSSTSNAVTSTSHTHSVTGFEPSLAANRKRQIFVQAETPSGAVAGDLWVVT